MDRPHVHTLVGLGSDHAGFEYKELTAALLDEMGVPYRDFGTDSEESVDYPCYAHAVARAVADGDCCCGILVCGTGVGMSLVANKVPGIRAALCNDTYTARVSRLHNDANVLCLSGRVVGREIVRDVVRTWITTPFSGDERHVRRLNQLRQIEEQYLVKPPADRSEPTARTGGSDGG